MRRGMNKKGLELAINTFVIFILAILLLGFLIVFFTGASSDFMTKIKSYFSYSNVDNVIEGCNLLADTDSKYSFCCESKEVKYFEEGEKVEGDFSCQEVTLRFGEVNSLNCEEVSC